MHGLKLARTQTSNAHCVQTHTNIIKNQGSISFIFAPRDSPPPQVIACGNSPWQIASHA